MSEHRNCRNCSRNEDGWCIYYGMKVYSMPEKWDEYCGENNRRKSVNNPLLEKRGVVKQK